MILELLEGGELFDKIRKKTLKKESDIALILKSLLKAVDEIHA